MYHWTKRMFLLAAPLLLTGCLWGPGRFTSDLTLKKDGSFVLDYRGELVLQLPPDEVSAGLWTPEIAHCFQDREPSNGPAPVTVSPGSATNPASVQRPKERPCTSSELARLKSEFEKAERDRADKKRIEAEQMAKMFGLPGLDDESNRLFAAKLMKYAGWRSVKYRGHGVFDVDYHFVGSAKQDFLFPALPDNDLLIPFIAIRRRTDGSVLVTAPALTGGAGPLAARAAMAENPGVNTKMVSRAEGRFTVITDGEVLTNNSDDGPGTHALGREIHWDVNASSKKIPETLIRL